MFYDKIVGSIFHVQIPKCLTLAKIRLIQSQINLSKF